MTMQLERRDLKTTEEMLDLFEAGLKLVAEGHAEVDYESTGSEQYYEFLRISKRLEWRLLQLPLHCASVFDVAVESSPPSDQGPPERCMFQDWELVRAWRKALMDALDARNKRAAVAQSG